MGIADKIRDTAEDLKDKAGGAVSELKHKAGSAPEPSQRDATTADTGAAGVGEAGKAATRSVNPGEPAGRTSETRHETVNSPKLQGF
jgi:hypothetical protein